ncbi:chymotrypsin family serine protease [Tsukamurella soli]|uniref:Trypsin n=1 Tax=Tsukamurella soli TaxID=644556 RepID=A0ABP8JQD9_9ACTN
MRTHLTLIAALVTATAACTGPATGTAPTAVQAGAGAGAGVSAPEWVTPSWTGRLNTNKGGDQYGATPLPGVVVAQQQGTASPYRCTFGVAVSGPAGPAWITAGHCDETPGAPLFVYPTTSISGSDAVQLPDTYESAEAEESPDPATGLVSDSALLPVRTLAPAATMIAGHFPVEGVLTESAVKALPVGTTVCFDGAHSGVTCGPLTSTDGLIHFNVTGAPGDSGAPVFAVDAQDRAALIGLLKGGDTEVGTAYATMLDPALSRLHAHVKLDPSATHLTGTSFSQSVSPAS